jgi:hypothetical protein
VGTVSRRERNIDQQIRDRFKSRPDIIAKKRHGSRFSVKEPDWTFIVLGRTIVIEMKRSPGEEPDKGQELRLREYAAAGARTAVCSDVNQVVEIINEEEARMRRLLAYEAEGYT